MRHSRSLATLAALVGISAIIVGCGAFKKKDKGDDDDESADAIAGDSDVQWDTDYHLEGTLVADSTRTSRYKHVLSDEFLLRLNSETNMRLAMGEVTSKCPSAKQIPGVFFTLTSPDGLYVRSTNTIDQIVTPVPIDAFPGRVPAGQYLLEVKAYGEGACTVDATFHFPNPHADADFPPEGDGTLDPDVLGAWSARDVSGGISLTSTMTFQDDHSAMFSVYRGDLVQLAFNAKYRVDVHTVPKRMLLTVTSVANNQSDPSISVNKELRCLYFGQPSGAANSLYWQCQDDNALGFPVDFDDDALEFRRDAAGPSGTYNFQLTKGGNTSVSIPDNDLLGTAYPFEFSTDTSRVVDLGIAFTVDHPNVGDLRLILVHPDGTSAELYNRVASTTTHLTRSFGVGGSYLASLAAFAGKAVNGRWKLVVADESATDTGILTNATLTVRGRY